MDRRVTSRDTPEAPLALGRDRDGGNNSFSKSLSLISEDKGHEMPKSEARFV